jgi:hypothetical protein
VLSGVEQFDCVCRRVFFCSERGYQRGFIVSSHYFVWVWFGHVAVRRSSFRSAGFFSGDGDDGGAVGTSRRHPHLSAFVDVSSDNDLWDWRRFLD